MRAVLESGGEDPLENEEQLTDQMDALPFLCRFQYERTCLYLVALMDPLLLAYTAAASNPGAPSALAPIPGWNAIAISHGVHSYSDIRSLFQYNLLRAIIWSSQSNQQVPVMSSQRKVQESLKTTLPGYSPHLTFFISGRVCRLFVSN